MHPIVFPRRCARCRRPYRDLFREHQRCRRCRRCSMSAFVSPPRCQLRRRLRLRSSRSLCGSVRPWSRRHRVRPRRRQSRHSHHRGPGNRYRQMCPSGESRGKCRLPSDPRWLVFAWRKRQMKKRQSTKSAATRCAQCFHFFFR